MDRTVRLFILVQLVLCVIGAIGCGGDESANECADAKEVQLEAIQKSCDSYSDCCYCLCELSGSPGADCNCGAWGILVRDKDVSRCEGGDLNYAVNCLNDKTNCSQNLGDVIMQRCAR
jgi:hypothetical protein